MNTEEDQSRLFLSILIHENWLIDGYWLFFSNDEWEQITSETVITHDGFDVSGCVNQIDSDSKAAEILLDEPLQASAFIQSGFEIENLVFHNKG